MPGGRPYKEKLEYFSHDVDMRNDEALRYLCAKYKSSAPYAIFNIILETIYGSAEGYYLTLNDRQKVLISDLVYSELSLTLSIINDTITEDLFNNNLFNVYNILTSDAIQKRYLMMCSRRKSLSLTKEYLLINPLDYITKGSDLSKSGNIKIFSIQSAEPQIINVDNNYNKNNINTTSKSKSKSKKDNYLLFTREQIFEISEFEKIPEAYREYLTTHAFDINHENALLISRLGAARESKNDDLYNTLIDCQHILKEVNLKNENQTSELPENKVVKTYEELHQKLTGEIYIQGVCASQGWDYTEFKEFAGNWLEKRRLSNDWRWPSAHLARQLISNFEEKKQKQNGKPAFKKSNTPDTQYKGTGF